jgi:hypothetical protein
MTTETQEDYPIENLKTRRGEIGRQGVCSEQMGSILSGVCKMKNISTTDTPSEMIEKFKSRERIAPYKKGYKNLNYRLSEKGRKILQNKGKKKVLNKDTGDIYSSLNEASIKLNSNPSYLSKLLNGKVEFSRRKKSKYNIEWI